VRYLQSRKFCLITHNNSNRLVHPTAAGHLDSITAPKFRPATNRRVLSGSILDISQDGAYISSFDPVEEQAQLVLTFTPPGSEDLVTLVGEVAWVNNGRDASKQQTP
jgi:hypothetical protein